MILFSCYAAVVPFLFVALVWWKLKNRPTKHPLGQDVKLRRQAVEHLRKNFLCGYPNSCGFRQSRNGTDTLS
jgi:hypothetical protein